MNTVTDKMQKGRLVEKCHMCKGGSLTRVLDLGFHPHSDHFPTKIQVEEGDNERYPLRLVSCGDCGLLQIDYLVNPKILYQTDYLYQSLATTKTGSAHFKNLADGIAEGYAIPKGSLAVDVGSNVGSLLNYFKEFGFRVLGVDPADNIAQIAIENGIPTVADFFDSRVAKEIAGMHGKAHVITGTNVFAHLHEIDDAVAGMKELLVDDGIMVVEAPYAVDLIEQMAYDTIYHQHVGYLSVKPMERYFRRFGLELFNIKKSGSHGGSLQYHVGHAGKRQVSPLVSQFIKEENEYGLYSLSRLSRFAEDVSIQKREMTELLIRLKKEGNRIVGLSAPAKGNTLLNYCNVDNTILDFVTEKNPLKIGRFTPGTFIPIYDDERLLKEQPDFALLLAWNFASEIMKNLEEFKKRGGRFIIPIPRPTII